MNPSYQLCIEQESIIKEAGAEAEEPRGRAVEEKQPFHAGQDCIIVAPVGPGFLDVDYISVDGIGNDSIQGVPFETGRERRRIPDMGHTGGIGY